MASLSSSPRPDASTSSTISSPALSHDQQTSPNLPSSSSSVSSPSFLPPRVNQQSPLPHSRAPLSISSAPAGYLQLPRSSNPPPRPTTVSHISPHLPQPTSSLEIQTARSAVVATLSNLLDSSLQSRAQVLHSNSEALGKQETQLHKATEALRKENDKLGKVATDAAKKLKLVGNVQNWAEVLERDFLVLQETVRLAEEDETSDEEGECRDSCCSCSEYDGDGDGPEDDIDRDRRMAAGLDFMGRKFEDDPKAHPKDQGKRAHDDPDVKAFGTPGGEISPGDKGKGKELLVTETDVVMVPADGDEEGYGSHTAFSDTSRSVAEGSMKAKESETTSLSTMGG